MTVEGNRPIGLGLPMVTLPFRLVVRFGACDCTGRSSSNVIRGGPHGESARRPCRASAEHARHRRTAAAVVVDHRNRHRAVAAGGLRSRSRPNVMSGGSRATRPFSSTGRLTRSSRASASPSACERGVTTEMNRRGAKPLTIEAGMLDVADWSASWITPAILDPLDRPAPSPFIRRTFTTAPRAVAHARLYVTSAGVHRIHLNGEVVGDHVLAPGWSSYTNRIRYDTHDVTSLITGGDNVIGAVVADGWWRGFLKWDMLRNVYGERIGLLAQLEITYDDGSTDVVVTDDEWRSTTGPILAADLYQGENYDARLELDGWDRPGFDDTAWEPVERFAPDVGALVAPPGPPVRRIEELAVREVLTSPSGATVLDFGQNLVGRVRFTVDGDAGTVITLRHAEVLEHGEPAYRPLRNAEATDQYTLRGEGPETWEPTFTFHGFRYVEVRRLARRARSCRLRRRRVALRHGTHRDVLVRQRPAQPTPLERRVGHAWQLPRRADRLPTARRTARLDRRPPGVRPDGGVPLRRQRHDRQLARGPPRGTARRRHRADLHPLGAAPGVPDPCRRMERRRDRRARGAARGVRRQPDCWPRCSTPCGRGSTASPPRRGPSASGTRGSSSATGSTPTRPPDAPMLGRTDSKLVATAYFARSAQIVSDAAGVFGQRRPAGDLRRAGGRGPAGVPARIRDPEGPRDVRHRDRLLAGARVRDDRGPGRVRAGRCSTVGLRRRVAVPDHHRIPRHAGRPPGTEQQRRQPRPRIDW